MDSSRYVLLLNSNKSLPLYRENQEFDLKSLCRGVLMGASPGGCWDELY